MSEGNNKSLNITDSPDAILSGRDTNIYAYRLEPFIEVITLISECNIPDLDNKFPQVIEISKKIPYNKLESKNEKFSRFRENFKSIENAKNQMLDNGKIGHFNTACDVIIFKYIEKTNGMSQDEIIYKAVAIWDDVLDSIIANNKIIDPIHRLMTEHLMFYVFSHCKIFFKPPYEIGK